MLIRLINQVRCHIVGWLLDQTWGIRYGIARRIAPSTTSLVKHRTRRPPPLRLPPRSHIIYHQENVDRLAAQNSLASLAAQLPPEDEILLLDVGASADASWLEPFRGHAWHSYVAARAEHPEQRSYTYGLNATMSGLKAPWLFVWRTDYVYPAGVVDAYLRHLPDADFAAPYRVWIGNPEVDSGFLKHHASRFYPFDMNFWAEKSVVCSLYETQDPALFAIKRSLWEEIGGLNHELWGYGWQFAEFAARVRVARPEHRIRYFDCPPPLHQTHAGSLMHQTAPNQAEAATGMDRFTKFLGGPDAMKAYRLRHLLPPRPPA